MIDTSNRRAIQRYSDLEELKKAHANLLRRSGLFKEDRAFWDEVMEFLTRACGTGTVLEAEAERYAAQGLITYWTNALYRAVGVSPENNLLVDFDPTWCPELDESQRPYTRPKEFIEGKVEHLFGWDRLVKECLDKLEANGLVVVVGGPGSGRRSLVTEGVLPALQAGALPGSGGWRLLPIEMDAEPLVVLARAVAPAVDMVEAVIRLHQEPAELARLLGDQPTVLYLDQFYRLFTAEKREQIDPFINALVALVEGRRHRVIVPLRSEDLGHVAAIETLKPIFERGQVFIAFTARELRQAIEEPARKVGLRYDPGLIDRILLDVQGDPAAATLLQFTLLQLWENRQGNRITMQTYERLGGGRIGVGRAAERVYQSCAAQGDGDVVRRLWISLVQPMVGGGWQGRVVRRSELYRDGEENERVDRVLEELSNAGLLSRRPGNTPGAETLAPIFDAIIEVWPRLVEWLAELSDQRRRWERLRAAAEQWHDSQEHRSLLWGGQALAEAHAYPNLTDLERKFLRASQEEEDWQSLKKQLWIAALVLLAIVVTVVPFLLINQRLALRVSLMRVSMSLRHVDAGAQLADRGDVAGAVTWYGQALVQLDENRNVLSEKDYQHLKENYQLRLGLAWRRLPVIRQLLYYPDMSGGAFSLDGRWAATTASIDAGSDETLGSKVVRLWDLRSGKDYPLNHDDPVNEVAFNLGAKERYLVTAGGSLTQAGQVRVWRIDVGHEVVARAAGKVRRLPLPGKVTQAEFSPDGRKVLIVLKQQQKTQGNRLAGAVVVFDHTNGELTGRARVLRPRDGGVINWAALRPPAGDRVVAAVQEGADNGKVVAWDAQSEKEVFVGHHTDRAPVTFVGFARQQDDQAKKSPRPRRLFLTCGGRDRAPSGEAVLWDGDGDSPKLLSTLPHKSAVTHGAFNHDASVVVTCGQDGFAYLWTVPPARGTFPNRPIAASVPTASRISTLAHDADVYWADFSPDGRYVVTACRDRAARVWDSRTGRLAFPQLSHGGTVSRVQFSEDGRDILSFNTGISRQGVKEATTAHVWELLDDGRPEWSVITDGAIRHASFDPTGKCLVTVAGRDHRTEAQVWDAVDGQPLSPPLHGNDEVRFAAVSPDGRRVVTLSGKTAYLWDAQKGVLLQADTHCGTVNYACFSPTGKWLLTAAGDERTCSGEAKLWRAKDGQQVRELEHDSPVLFGVFSHDETQVLTAGGNLTNEKSEARLWAVPSGKRITHLQVVHKEPITHAAFSADDRQVVTSSTDNTACVWNVKTAAYKVLVLKKHTADVVQAAFSSDGQRVVTAGMDGAAIVWDARTGSDLAILPHNGSVHRVSFSPDGRYVVTASHGSIVSLWDVQPEQTAPGEIRVHDQRLIAALRHPGEVGYVAFIDDGARLRTLSYTESDTSDKRLDRLWLKTRDLSPDQRPVSQILGQAQFVAKRSVKGETNSLEVDPVEELWQRWTEEREKYHNALKDRVAPAQQHRYEADKAEAAGLLRAARRHLGRAIELDPVQSFLLARRARLCERGGQWQQALADLGRAIEVMKRPGRPASDGLLASLYARRAEANRMPGGKLPQALRDYEEAVRLNPNDPSIWKGKAEFHWSRRDWERAIECCDRAVKLDDITDTKDPKLRIVRSGLLSENAQLPSEKLQKRYRDVIDDCDVAIGGEAPTVANWVLYLRRAVARKNEGGPDNLTRAVDDYLKAAQGCPTYFPDRAVDAYSQALSLAEKHAADRVAEILKGRGQSLKRMGPAKMEDARRDFERAAELSRGESKKDWQLWLELAQLARQSRDWKEAARAYNEALRFAPEEKKVELWQGLAQLHALAGDWPSAVEAYSSALRVRPDDTLLLRARAEARAHAGQLTEALEDFASANKNNPPSPSLHDGRARLYEIAGHWKEAVAEYTRAIDLQPAGTLLYEKRARALVELGQWAAAAADLRQQSGPALPSPVSLLHLITVQFQADDRAGVRQSCMVLLKYFKQTPNALTANDTAWALVLSGETGDTAKIAVELAQRAVNTFPSYASYLNTLGAAHYRAGNDQKAVGVLNQSRDQFRKDQEIRRIRPVEDGIVEDWLFLAMAHQRLGQPEEAKKWLDRAKKWIEADGKRSKPDDPLTLFWKRLARRVLLAEAEKLVDSAKR
jgi:WD40 repeat protein/tetratricopeptide (TPR) repeat protein